VHTSNFIFQMSFRRSQLGTRGKTKRPAWAVEHQKIIVRRSTSLSSKVKQHPLPSTIPSYSLGSTSNPGNVNNLVVTRHHSIRLSDHHPQHVNKAHNGPLIKHTITSPRHKVRHRLAPQSPFSLVEHNRPSSAPPSNRQVRLEEPTIKSNSSLSAEQRASARRIEMEKKAEQKQQRAVNFQIALKKRLSKKVKNQRQQAKRQREAWIDLEEKSKKNAADWVAYENNNLESVDETFLKSNNSIVNNTNIREPQSLQNHMQQITAQSQEARAALISRRKNIITRIDSTEKKSSEKTISASAKVITTSADTPSSSVKSDWSPNLVMNNGVIDSNIINRQSRVHLVQSVHKAEALAQRKQAKLYREHLRRKAENAKREAEMGKLRELQDSRVEESRMANVLARDEYEQFLREAEEGIIEINKKSREKIKREESVGARYVAALRENLYSKLKTKGLHVPNLCSCVPEDGKIEVYR
jgi:hypothetical protein